jgi:hypothetical protein
LSLGRARVTNYGSLMFARRLSLCRCVPSGVANGWGLGCTGALTLLSTPL